MTFEPSPKQALVLWSLVVAVPGEEPSRSTLKPRLNAVERRQLLDADLIEEEKRGRAYHLLLADKGWEWAERQNLVKLCLSPNATPVLEKLIQALVRFLARNDVRLAEVIATIRSPQQHGSPPLPAVSPPNLEDQIRAACLSLTCGEYERRVRLADLRSALSGLSRDELDEVLLQMDQLRAIQLMMLEQPSDVTAEDRAAAIFLAGHPLHILYLLR